MGSLRKIMIMTAALASASAGVGVTASSAGAATLATIAVNTTSEAAVDGLCALREAVAAANTNQRVDACAAGGLADVITMPAGTYVIAQGPLVLERSTVIRGYGATLTRPAADGTRPETLVHIAATAYVGLTGVTLDGAGRGCAALVNDGSLLMLDGSVTDNFSTVPHSCALGVAAFTNAGSATLLRSSLSDNRAELVPSAFVNTGKLRIVGSTLARNTSMPFIHFALQDASQNHGALWLEDSTIESSGGVALRNLGNLTARATLFTGNEVALANEGEATVVRSTVLQNGLGLSNLGSLRMDYSTVSDNAGLGPNGGGGIANSGTLLVDHSAVTSNRGAGRGGITSSGTLTMRDSTVAGNVAGGFFNLGGPVNPNGAGGLVVEGGTARLENVTLADNHYEAIPDGEPPTVVSGGIYVGAGSVYLTNTALALNGHDQPADANGLDCVGSVTSLGYTYLQRPTGCLFTSATGDITGGTPLLAELGNRGGPTRTLVPLPGSPLIDHGSPAAIGGGAAQACSQRDQRGTLRPVDGDGDGIARCDIGAVERRAVDRSDLPPAA